MLLESYNGLLQQARSLNDLNRINIAFGNTMTPQEAVELTDTLAAPDYQLPVMREDRLFSDAQFREVAQAWVDEVNVHLKMVGKAEAEPFLRRDLRKSVTLYTDGQPSGGKTLIVGFPGANHRLMMPVAALLQALPADRVDIVMIRDGTVSAYREGLEGLGDSLEDFADALPQFLNFAGYSRVVGMGVSSGGLPILLISLRLDLEAVLVCGGNSPRDPRWERPGDLSPVAQLEAAKARGYRTKVTVGYGVHSEPDRVAAMDIAECLDIEPISISSPRIDVKHNILYPLGIDGLLPQFLQERLGF